MPADLKWSPAALCGGVLLAVVSAAPAAAQSPGSYEDAYLRYLAAARRPEPTGRPVWMADLTSDPSARHVNDLVTIRVEESISAVGSADSNLGKSGSAAASVPGTGGEWLAKGLPISTETKFNGAGGTTRTTELSATLTARITEVLPNGDLVVEGVREIDINGDRSVVVLTGVVRPTDIRPGNVVPSALVGQLRIRSLSAGLMKDSLTPGWLIRILNKVF
jgi:flagellar L-ring protein precursor FlgH